MVKYILAVFDTIFLYRNNRKRPINRIKGKEKKERNIVIDKFSVLFNYSLNNLINQLSTIYNEIDAYAYTIYLSIN